MIVSGRVRQTVFRKPHWRPNRHGLIFAVIFMLGMDFWAWEAARPTMLGLPIWLFYFVLLSVLQTCAMIWLIRSATIDSGL
jgi:hypothetical protein